VERGVLYKATGESYIKEAEYSARSVKNNSSDLRTAIITDDEVTSNYFDMIIEPTKPLRNDNSSNILYPDKSPFDRTIYLDTDTYVCSNISSVVNLLEDFNLGVTIATSRHTIPNKGEPFVGYSGGILVFDNSEEINEFHKLWYNIYWKYREKYDITRNQPSLSSAILDSEADFLTLPDEYNTFINSGSDVGFLYRQAKILHGRPQEYSPIIEEKLNENNGMRVYRILPGLLNSPKVKIIQPSQDHIVRKLYRSLLTNGFRRTLQKSKKRISETYSLWD
jgi:hypothetical protein